MAKVLRILSVAALLVAVVAGCGDAAPQRSTAGGVPRALARQWEAQASAIADAARAGQDCEALRLARSLRAEVSAKRQELPLRLRAPLVTGVKALAGRITCVPPTTSPKPKPPPKPDHGHKKHGHGDHHGDGDHGGEGP